MSKTKVILITGTSRGIGKYLAEYYCEKHFFAAGCSRSVSTVSSANYRHFTADVTDEVNVKKMFSEIRKSYGRLDILINNAGIASMNHAMLTPLKTAENIIRTNFTAPFLFCREAAKIMLKNNFGRIINLSSVAADINLEGEAVYAASKSALVSFTKTFSKEISGYGITVNSIGLTPVKTDLVRNVPDKKMNELLSRLSIKRFAGFSDISNVTDFLISEGSGFITGQNINLGGI